MKTEVNTPWYERSNNKMKDLLNKENEDRKKSKRFRFNELSDDAKAYASHRINEAVQFFGKTSDKDMYEFDIDGFALTYNGEFFGI